MKSQFKFLCSLLFIFISFMEMKGQRVFAPSEEGFLIEIKEGEVKKTLSAFKPQTSIQSDKIIPNPFKIYIYSENPIGEDEIYLRQIMTSTIEPKFYWEKDTKKYSVKGINLTKISSYIYEIVIDGEFEWDPEQIQLMKEGKSKLLFTNIPEFVIVYNPNKQSKKEGKQKKYWYAGLSEIKYNPRQIKEWSTEDALISVEQIIKNEEEPNRLFASIKPSEVIPQAVNEQQIQYVIVQNQVSNIPNENNQSNQNEEKKEIISDVDKNIPYRDINNENTFALIIANEDYNKVAPVNFALRDGQKINEYLKKTLGIGKDHIVYLENATLNDMRYEMNRLSKISDAYNGEASFIIYYIGHGIPDEKNGNGYLLPVDGYGNDVTTAYPLEELYSQLSGLDAKKIVLFTDACFSGANKSGDMLVAARGIAIRSTQNEAKGHLIAFSACQGDETAYSYNEQGHGLLTYYFLKKLKETGGQTTLGELEEYIVDNVGKTAIVINGKSQTPRVSVSPELRETWRDVTLFE